MHWEGFSWRLLSSMSFENGRRGLVGTANGVIVEVESRHGLWAVGGFGLCSHPSVEAKAKKQGPLEVLLLSSPFARDFSGPNIAEMSFEKHKSLCLANPGATLTSRKIWLRTLWPTKPSP